MGAVFSLGFLLGLQHALEADHLAAIAAIARNTSSRVKSVAHGCAWGIGHTLALLVLVTVVMAGGFSISEDMSHWLEFGVGMMLIVLGVRAIVTARKRRMHHAPVHRHGNGGAPVHAHRHGHEISQGPADGHRPALSRHALLPLCVGLIHGVAGSAALVILLTAMSQSTVWQVAGYVMVFGGGSILGMAVMALTFSVPVGWVQAQAPWAGFAFSVTVGAGVIAIGVHRCLVSAPA